MSRLSEVTSALMPHLMLAPIALPMFTAALLLLLREEQQRPIDGLIVSLRAAGGSSVCVRPADRQSARDRPTDALPGTGSPCRARARRHCALPRCRSRHGDGRCA